jgi:hypothetical protein
VLAEDVPAGGVSASGELLRFQQALAEELKACRRLGRVCSVLHLQLSGHPPEPSRILSLLLNRVRRADLVTHLEGGEFAILLPKTPRLGARRLGESLQELLCPTGSEGFTVGFGSVTFPEYEGSECELTARARGLLHGAAAPVAEASCPSGVGWRSATRSVLEWLSPKRPLGRSRRCGPLDCRASAGGRREPRPK